MGPSTIEAISVQPLTLALTEPFSIATGSQPVADNLLVMLRLADGSIGLGECAPVPHISGETVDSTRQVLQQAEELLRGGDVRRWRMLAASLHQAFPGAGAAHCGLEMAILDALGRHLGVPTWQLWGGRGVELRTDMTITAGDTEHAARSAEAVTARGIDTIKIKVGARPWQEDVQRLAAIHANAPSARLLVDANGGYGLQDARGFLGELQRQSIPLALLEQPLPRDDPHWADLAAESPVPLCADESARSAADVIDLVRGRQAHVVNIKPMKCGFVQALGMWHVARAAGLGLMIGGMVESILAMTASAHFAAGLGGFQFVDLDTPMFIVDQPFTGGFAQHGDRLGLEHIAAGHGVDLADPG